MDQKTETTNYDVTKTIIHENRIQAINSALGECKDLYEIQGDMQKLELELETATREMEYISDTTMTALCEEVNDKDKPRFSNEAARKAELRKRLAGNAAYQMHKEQERKLRAELSLLSRKSSFSFNRLNVFRSFLEGGV